MGRQRIGRFEVPRIALVGALLAVAATAALAAYFASSAPATSQLSAPITLWARSSTLAGRDITVSGRIVAGQDLSGAVVKVYRREIGESSDTFVADATVNYDNMMSGNTFSAVIPAVTRSCQITAAWAGNSDYLASSSWMFAGVRPKLKLVAKTTTRGQAEVPHHGLARTALLPAASAEAAVPRRRAVPRARRLDVVPGRTRSRGHRRQVVVHVQYYDVKPGTYLMRAHFGGTNYNVAGDSAAQRIVVP